MAQVTIEKIEMPVNDPDAFKQDRQPFSPTGKQLADLSRSAKCHADVFKDGAGKDALAAITMAAQVAATIAAAEVQAMVPAPPADPGPGTCWNCGHTLFETIRTEHNTTKRCYKCAAKYVTQRNS